MTKIRSYTPPDRALAQWVRDVVARLAGIPQVERVVYRHDFAELPIDVKVKATKAPAVVSVLRVQPEDGSTDLIVSGGVVQWKWRGASTLRIVDISTITSGIYAVGLELQGAI